MSGLRAEFIRSHPDKSFKHSAKMLWILESDFVGNLTRCFIRRQELFFCQFNHFILNIFGDGFTSLLTNHIAKVVGRKEYFVGKVFDRWQS